MKMWLNRTARGAVAFVAIVAASAAVVHWMPVSEPVDAAPKSVSELEEQSNAFAEVVEKTSPAVVHLQVTKTIEGGPANFPIPDLFRRFFDVPEGRGPEGRGPEGRQPRQFKRKGQGSGFIISKEGYIVSNHHVVGNADEIEVVLEDGRKFNGKLVGSDPESDVALLKIDGNDLPTLPLGDSEDVKVGDWVLALGSPFGLSSTVTAGIVSAKGRSETRITNYDDFIQTDAAINPGNSGGPLVNLEGEAVGLNTAILSRSGGYMGVGFSIPINMVEWIKTQIVEKGEVSRGYLGVGIQAIDEGTRQAFDLGEDVTGALISDVQEGSAAAKAGIQRGDVVVELNGEPVEDFNRFRHEIAMIAPGTDVELTVLRDGSRKTLTVTLDKRPKPDRMAQRSDAEPNEDLQNLLGFSVQSLDEELAQQLGYEGKSGVVITGVQQFSEAAEKGLRRGTLIEEVNRQAISNAEEFNEIVRNHPKDEVLLLSVTRGDLSRFVTLQLSN